MRKAKISPKRLMTEDEKEKRRKDSVKISRVKEETLGSFKDAPRKKQRKPRKKKTKLKKGKH